MTRAPWRAFGAKIGLKLVAHEAGNPPTLLLQLREERALVAIDHIVEHRFFRAMTLIATRDVAAESMGTGALNTATAHTPHCISRCPPPV
jgi:hypothetical protein